MRYIELAVIALAFHALPFIALAQTGVVQGYKVKASSMDLNATPPSWETISLDGTPQTSAQPYFLTTVSAGTHTISVSVPSGWSVGYTLCYNDTSCHTMTPTPGNSVSVNVTTGGYVDLWWHYTPIAPIHTLTKIFDGTLDYELYTPQRIPNVYAPHVLHEDGIYKMWYGGGGTDTRDRILYAESSDGLNWIKKGAVIDAGSDYNANDPTVVKVGNTYYMYFTVSLVSLIDRIESATSQDGIHWTKRGAAIEIGPYEWNARFVARPTVIYDDGIFKMWYDTTSGTDYFAPITEQSIGYATSSDGLVWNKYPNPVFSGFAAVDVTKWQGVYFMLLQGAWQGTLLATSADGISWQSKGTLISPSLMPKPENDPLYDSATDKTLGHLTPFFFFGPTQKPEAIYMGGGLPYGAAAYNHPAMYVYKLDGSELNQFLPTAASTQTPAPTSP